MKTIGIMQPYFIPYIGYFQLLEVSDVFVFHDDVKYIKNGWINRNRILFNGTTKYITLPVRKDTNTKYINERFFSKNELLKEKKYILSTIKLTYRKTPYFKAIYPLLESLINNEETNVSHFAETSILSIINYLGLNTSIHRSSEIDFDKSLKGQDRVIAIVKKLNGNHYVNPIGGIDLYNPTDFQKKGVKLQFLQSEIKPYKQFGNHFIPNLSIIDVMMFNSKQEVLNMLKQYTLIDKES
ncbi:MAG: WbqC family protein [Phycisphaerae bacterium]|nr:WbqC family protein [Phycisphaerae bacterium]